MAEGAIPTHPPRVSPVLGTVSVGIGPPELYT